MAAYVWVAVDPTAEELAGAAMVCVADELTAAVELAGTITLDDGPKDIVEVVVYVVNVV